MNFVQYEIPVYVSFSLCLRFAVFKFNQSHCRLSNEGETHCKLSRISFSRDVNESILERSGNGVSTKAQQHRKCESCMQKDLENVNFNFLKPEAESDDKISPIPS